MTILAQASQAPLWIVGGYLCLLLGLGVISSRFFRGTSTDFFVASRSIGPFMLLMSVFGTTMTAFALVGSTGKAYTTGIGVYGLMASWSGLIHSAVFFLVGIKLWAIGKRYGYVTQCQFFRDRFDSPALGYLLFPILVALIIPYLLIGLIGAGSVMRGVTIGMFPDVFTQSRGAVPPSLTGLVICGVVLFYVFFGGVRSTAWANTFQTIVFMVTGIIAFVLIAKALGGLAEASQLVEQNAPEHLAREGLIGKAQFASYLFVPLSVGMFPHLFQHWLTARSAKSFRLTVVAHPLFIMIVWTPCILIGIWALGKGITPPPKATANAILAVTVKTLLHNPYLTGLLTAGILAAIMSSLDSQFMCLGTMFTNDITVRLFGPDRLSDGQKLWMGRSFVVVIVTVTYLLSLLRPPHIFDLGVWCFSGFGSLFPLVFAAIYWRRATKAGAICCVLVTAAVWITFFLQDFTTKSGSGNGEFLVLGMMPVAIIFAASAISLVVVSALTRPPPAATINKFVPPLSS